MKTLLSMLTLLFISAALAANPIMAAVVSEIWFTTDGDLMIEFLPNFEPINLSNVLITHGLNQQSVPVDLVLNQTSSPYCLNITETMPGFVLNPESDSLQFDLYYSDHNTMYLGGVKWGSTPDCSITPLLPGQSIVYCHVPYSFYSVQFWVKDEPPTPGQNPYYATARDTIRIVVTNQNGYPVANAGVENYFSSPYLFYTDANGEYTYPMIAGKMRIKVHHPETQEVVYDQYHFLEPNQSTLIPVSVVTTENQDELIPVIAKGLHAYPNPFNSNASGSVSFTYDGNIKLSKDSYIRIYDTKGRFITRVEINAKGTASWQPSSDIVSGMYFARLISGNRIVDTTTLTIVK